MILYMYIALGQGADRPLGDKVLISKKCLVTSFICCKFQKYVWFYTIFFMILYMYIAPGQGQTTLGGQNFDVNRNVLSLHAFVASLKKISVTSDFIHFFFHDFIHVYSPRQWLTTPWGQKFYINKNILSLFSFVAIFKEISLKSDFIQKSFITLPICCKFQRNLFEVWFYTILYRGQSSDVNRNFLSLQSSVASFKS